MSSKLRNNLTITISIFIVVLLFIIIYNYKNILPEENTTSEENNNIDSKRITALDEFNTAKGIAKKWNKNTVLQSVTSDGSFENGLSTCWRFYFIFPSTEIVMDNITKREGIYVWIYSNGKTKIENASSFDNTVIKNWSIDSDYAYDLAKSENIINEFLLKYSDARIDGVYLQMNRKYSSQNAIWEIRWHSSGIMDNPHNAYIVIDAYSGQVLDVEAQI